MIGGGYATEGRQFDDRVGVIGVGHNRSHRGWVGLGSFGLLLQLLQVLQKHVVGARAREEHPCIGDLHSVVWRGQRPVLRRHLIRPVDTVRVEVGDRRAEQRLERAAVERRKCCRRLPEKLLRRFLQVGNAGVIDGCVPVDLDAGIDITGPDFHFGRLGVERYLDQPSHHWVANKLAIGVPDAEAHAPDKFELRFDNAALELLLQREELGVKADGLAAKPLFLGPGAPRRVEVGSELGSDLRSLVVVREGNGRPRVDGRPALLRRICR